MDKEESGKKEKIGEKGKRKGKKERREGKGGKCVGKGNFDFLQSQSN
jgi:hypothetical protein